MKRITDARLATELQQTVRYANVRYFRIIVQAAFFTIIKHLVNKPSSLELLNILMLFSLEKMRLRETFCSHQLPERRL